MLSPLLNFALLPLSIANLGVNNTSFVYSSQSVTRIILLLIPRAGAMTPQHAHPGGVPIEAGVNTVLGRATKRVEVR